MRLDERDLVLGDAVLLVELLVCPRRGPMSAVGTQAIDVACVACWVILRSETRNRTNRVARYDCKTLSLALRCRTAQQRDRSAVQTDAWLSDDRLAENYVAARVRRSSLAQPVGTSTFHLSIEVRVLGDIACARCSPRLAASFGCSRAGLSPSPRSSRLTP